MTAWNLLGYGQNGTFITSSQIPVITCTYPTCRQGVMEKPAFIIEEKYGYGKAAVDKGEVSKSE
jgi:hypothetical protein